MTARDDRSRSTAPTLSSPDTAREAGGRLDWTDLNGQPRSLPLGASVRIGRSSDNDIILNDGRVSRRHARIVAEAGRYLLTDLNSGNGTFVNDAPITGPTELHPGDRIGIGETVLTFGTVAPLSVSEEPALSLPKEPALSLPKGSELPRRPERQAGPRLVAATLAADGSTVVPAGQTTVGWLELPTGEERILGSEVRIGRASKNDITIEDAEISRVHALIRRIDDRYVLSDLGSANGVAVNGEPVLTPRALEHGDRIELGDTTLRFYLRSLAGADGPAGGEEEGVASQTSIFSLAGLTGPSSRALTGDLRVVTILFSDMRGYTAMSERLNNAELTTAIMNQVFDRLTAEIARFDGSVNSYAGDKVMAIFGAPRAHEDDPERAIKAALAMDRALESFNRELQRRTGLMLQMRTGINTGEVLFGQVGGRGATYDTVMGDAVNVAARLEPAARVGHILVGETTYHLAKHAFHFTPLPPMEVKGKSEPIQSYEVVREKRADEVLREPAGGDTLVGREQELQQLRVALEEAAGGQGRLVAVVGDIGIGTSQLLAAFQRSYAQPGTTWLKERCLSYNQNAPYALLGGLLRSLLGLDCEEALDRTKLLNALKETLGELEDETRAEYLALSGQILGVQVNHAFIAGLEPKVRRKLTTAMIRALVAGRTRRGALINQGPTLVLMLEEMQWADSASVDALDDLVEALPGLPVLLLLAYRPEWSHAWTGRSFYRQINLPELTQEQSRRFLRQLLRAADLPDPVADVVIAHCGGNPLLLEETVKSLQERGALVARKGSWTLAEDVSVLQLPTNLRGIMMARLDRLESQDRAVLQKASVIGRSFTYRVLALITGLDDELDESLERLQDQELILETPLAAEPEYTFKHTIVQEIAYNNLLVAERRVLHERVGDALERINAERPDDQLEVLAYHYSRSGNKHKAIEYLIRSGEKARRLYANETAIGQFEEALEKYRSLPTTEQEPARLVHLYEVLGDVHLLTANFRSAQENFEAGIAEATGAGLDSARLWNRLGLVWERRGDYRRALRSYERGLAALGASPAAPRPLDQAVLQASAARAQAHRGDYAEAARLARAALDGIGRQLGPDEKRTRADALHVLGLVAYAGGQPDEALTHHLQSLELRLELGDTMGMQESYNQLGAIYWSRGQLDQAFEHLVSLTQVLRLNMRGLEMPSQARGQTGPLAPGQAGQEGQGGQEGELAPPPDGETAPIERFFRSGLAAAQQVGDLWGIAVSCNRLGGMLYRQGERERALYYLRRAVTEAERIGAREVAAQASISLGAILIGQGYADAGLKHLERGLTYAEAVDSADTLAEGHIRLAEGRLVAGDLTGALAKAQAGLEKAAQVQHHYSQGLAHRVLGQVATARADWVEADRHFRAAMELLSAIDAQQEVGRTLYHFAQMWQAWSRAGQGPLPEGATIMLQQAAQIFQRLDMQQDLAATRAALLA